jgi:hypothetical protein
MRFFHSEYFWGEIMSKIIKFYAHYYGKL